LKAVIRGKAGKFDYMLEWGTTFYDLQQLKYIAPF